MSDIQTSVVVPAYNCEKTIERTIQSILNQSVDSVELIVVDDGSSDGTAEKIKSFGGVKYLYQVNSGPAKARNLGAKEARGEYIFFTDSDCIPEKVWLEKGLKFLLEPKVSVVSGSYGIENTDSLLARCIHSEIIYRHNHLMPEYPKAFGSYNFGIKKEVFLLVGGFDEGYRLASGEDNDLSYRIIRAGYKIRFNKNMLVGHYHTEKPLKYLSEQYRHGFWRAKMYKDHPGMVVGDGYTFWKDAAEILASGLFLLFFLLSCFRWETFSNAAFLWTIFFVVFEVWFAKPLVNNVFEAFFMGIIMFLRSFCRMFGLSSGVLHNFFS